MIRGIAAEWCGDDVCNLCILSSYCERLLGRRIGDGADGYCTAKGNVAATRGVTVTDLCIYVTYILVRRLLEILVMLVGIGSSFSGVNTEEFCFRFYC
jgi:hypothetical protein